MRRREFITLLGGVAASWPFAVRAQQPERVRRVGVLMAVADPGAQSYVTAFRDALTKLGWAEGSNLKIELRWSAGDADRIRTLAKELVDLRPDVIVGQSTPVIAALVRETRTIPIVFANVADPVGSGFVESLAHPGGNLTGFTTDNTALGGKWVQLLKEIAPQTVRVALLFNPATAAPLKFYMPSVQAAASTSGIGVALLILCAGSARAAVIQIKIENLAFAPAQASAQVGDTIEWTNADFVAHTATARDGTFDIMLPPNATGTVVLKTAGTIDYYCRVHPNMTAQITVSK